MRTVPGLLEPIIRLPFRACFGVLSGSGLGSSGAVRGNAMTSSIAAPKTTTRGVLGATGRRETGKGEPGEERDDAAVEEEGKEEEGTEAEEEGKVLLDDGAFFRSERCPAITAATIALLITNATFASRDAPARHTGQISTKKSLKCNSKQNYDSTRKVESTYDLWLISPPSPVRTA
jgi:hypothetical protein